MVHCMNIYLDSLKIFIWYRVMWTVIELKPNTLPFNAENSGVHLKKEKFKQDKDAMFHFEFIFLLAMTLKRSHDGSEWEHPVDSLVQSLMLEVLLELPCFSSLS